MITKIDSAILFNFNSKQFGSVKTGKLSVCILTNSTSWIYNHIEGLEIEKQEYNRYFAKITEESIPRLESDSQVLKVSLTDY